MYPLAQLIFTACLTWMSFCVFDKTQEKAPSNLKGKVDMLPTCQVDKQNVTKQPDCSMTLICRNITSDDSNENNDLVTSRCFTPAVFSLIFLLFLIIFEIWQVTRAPYRFFRKSENWLDLLLIISTSASLITLLQNDFVKAVTLDQTRKTTGLRFFSGISIFLAWFKIVLLLQNLPKIGRYIRILKIVAKELLLFLLIYLPILIAFGICFFVLMPPKTSSFKDSWTSGLKVYAMLVGEIDFDGTSINNEDFDDGSELQILLLQIMSIFFLCLVCIVISNLLTGLAVKEIGKLMSEAWETEIKEKIDELIEDEDVTYNGIFNCFQNNLNKKLQGYSMICVKPNEIVQDDKHGNFSKIWNSISGSEKSFSVYIPSKYVDRRVWEDYGLFTVDVETGRWTLPDELESFEDDDLEKTDIKIPLKLIYHIKEYLKLEEEPSKKTNNDLWFQHCMD